MLITDGADDWKILCFLFGGIAYLLGGLFNYLNRKEFKDAMKDIYARLNIDSDKLSELKGEHNERACKSKKRCKNFKPVR